MTDRAFQWSFMIDSMFRPPVLEGVWTTLLLTVLTMLLGIALGVVLAVMRLSPNPILHSGSWTYIRFFRSVPRLVLAVLFGNLGILYRRLEFGFPFPSSLPHC